MSSSVNVITAGLLLAGSLLTAPACRATPSPRVNRPDAAAPSGTAATAAATCTPPPGFVDQPPPDIAPIGDLVARVEELIIDRPLDRVLEIAARSSLEDVIDRQSPLPSVAGTHTLTPGPFGAPGSRRLVCLSDRSTLVEQVLLARRDGRERQFRYRRVELLQRPRTRHPLRRRPLRAHRARRRPHARQVDLRVPPAPHAHPRHPRTARHLAVPRALPRRGLRPHDARHARRHEAQAEKA